MRLYKYRSLSNFENFVDIVLNKRLYVALYKDMNDPMEGQYLYHSGAIDRITRDRIYGTKQRLKLCSLSSDSQNALMWSHYADGCRGVAIEVELAPGARLRRVEYGELVEIFEPGIIEETAEHILSHKLDIWSYEQEWRVFAEGTNFVDVRISKVILGQRMSPNYKSLVTKLLGRIDGNIVVVPYADEFPNPVYLEDIEHLNRD
ncbi:DUF2971 domain-containing protein [Dyadobacter sp. CY327]|uniref:DUF2971 domain-containing protein n=1 Tax=Dyadobacter sp. CY327 TaxID=2907301 RepID=UPI001F39F558|nr:DUF2971 domain-containing protein [Dyadobacter sp. CY327]MCE7070941.1 DUF2971 domain-containing protein [Dyadobacter sp. CY327]